MDQQGNQPIKVFRAGSITASIWRNKKTQDGNIKVRHSVKIQKRFCNKKGEWQNSDYYFPDDLPKLQLVIAKTFELISLKESQDTEQSVPA